MNSKSEQALVGLFVIVAAGVLVGTIFAMSGAFGHTVKTFHTYFPFAGGLEPGATVRYSGGPKAGRVEKLRIDPQIRHASTSRLACNPICLSKRTAG